MRPPKMFAAGSMLTISAIIPLLIGVRANLSASLIHALVWATVAWLAWVAAAMTGTLEWAYLALSLTACAGVAVFGARRPGAGAWNFVVIGLLIVLALPLAQAGALRTAVRPDTMFIVLLGSLVGLTVVNYFPTRLGAGAVSLTIGCVSAYQRVSAGDGIGALSSCSVGLAPWLAWAGCLFGGGEQSGNRLWLTFRDRYGLVWGLRLREQFNRAAANAGIASRLEWNGLRPYLPPTEEMLAALTKRFFASTSTSARPR